jgi:zinc/manganese transport system substrate-binding protein
VARAELSVVATTADLAAISRAVGEGRVNVKALALHTQDPHWVDARPSLALALSQADLLLAVGAELEAGWLPTLQVGSKNGKIQTGASGYLDCASLVTLLEVPSGKVDRSHGDVHASGNPHYLLDPRAVERVAVGIAKRLAELDPEGRATYLDNTQRFLSALRQARQDWERRLAPLRGSKVVTFHRSLSYLADWLGLNVIATVEARPGIPPNPAHSAEVIDRAKSEGARLILQESYHPDNPSKLIAEKSAAKFLELPGGPDFAAGQSYVAFMSAVVTRLEAGL